MIEPLIKWTGSKRSQADEIVKRFPIQYNRYFEPFIGGGSVLYAVKPAVGFASDICKPLIDVYNMMKENPQLLSDSYEKMWKEFQLTGDSYYYEVRNHFNESMSPTDFLFLSRTCYTGMIRFNARGEFNQPVHIGRPGIDPSDMRRIIYDWNRQLSHITFYNNDYHYLLDVIKSDDFIYLDPPYFNTQGQYYGGIDFNVFLDFLKKLNDVGCKWILSYDGIRGNDDKTVGIPNDLYVHHEYLYSGNSSHSRLKNLHVDVYESIYYNYDYSDMGNIYKKNKLFPSFNK